MELTKTLCACLLALLVAAASPAQQPAAPALEPQPAGKVVPLPKPDTEGGRPLMQALRERRTTRSFDAARPLSAQVLSNLLWAACGVNRPESGKRTAPTAVNWQEIDVYVAKSDGVFLFDAKAHALRQVLTEDIRPAIGVQPFVASAPVTLIYVADFARMGRASQKDREFYSATDTGHISQNVYLFCASEGLNTVVIGMVKRDGVAAKLGLRPDQRVILAQPVGYAGG
ncbi:MAG TPA: SagB/ThcOx family dehydrogenase [Candidatus Brocadiia bacterium]|nr:SagB/ThcOx family dehydrogenase [Candidatus Brocadiia bacterium]